MKSIKIAFMIIIIVPIVLFAQNPYNHPESVAFNELYNSYFVSNYGNGSIAVVDTNYVVVDTLATGLTECLGIHLLDCILYVSCGNYLKGIDIVTGEIIFNLYVPANYWMDGITSDNSGNLYVVASNGQIYRIDIDEISYELFVTGLPNFTQDVEFDEENNRLLVVAWQSNSPIFSIDLENPIIEEIPDTNIGLFDGITMDAEGNVYVSSHINSGSVYRFESTFNEEPEQIPGNFDEPAGLHYNTRDDILAVPNYGGNTVEFIYISDVSIDQKTIDNTGFHLFRNYPNPFILSGVGRSLSTTISYQLTEPYNVKLAIYNIKGKKVRTLISEVLQAGEYSVNWNGKDSNGKQVSSGIYFYKLNSGIYEKAKKMILLK